MLSGRRPGEVLLLFKTSFLHAPRSVFKKKPLYSRMHELFPVFHFFKLLKLFFPAALARESLASLRRPPGRQDFIKKPKPSLTCLDGLASICLVLADQRPIPPHQRGGGGALSVCTCGVMRGVFDEASPPSPFSSPLFYL